MTLAASTARDARDERDERDEDDTLREGEVLRSQLPLTLFSSSGKVKGMAPVRKLKVRESEHKEPSSPDGLPESGERLKPWNPGPLSNEPEMEGVYHVLTFFYLLSSLRWFWRDKKNWFAIGNLSIYYPEHSHRADRTIRKKLSFRGPDFFVVLGVNPNLPRNSWVVEREGKYPDVIVEILSKRTATNDRGKKKIIYERIFKTPEYFLFDPDTKRIEGFRLIHGRYHPIRPDERGRLRSDRLDLSFGLYGDHLRFFTPTGALVPLPDEAAAQAMMDRELARIEKEFADVRAQVFQKENDRLAAKLRSLGIDPDKLD